MAPAASLAEPSQAAPEGRAESMGGQESKDDCCWGWLGPSSPEEQAWLLAASGRSRHVDACENVGLILTVDRAGTCYLKFAANRHAEVLHPNLHVPASLQDLELLGGGGSGVTVVKANDPHFGGVVLKHGSFRDTEENLALATVEEELHARSRDNKAAAKAAKYMIERTPDFKFMYISQAHLRDRGAELWAILRSTWTLLSLGGRSPGGESSPETPSSPVVRKGFARSMSHRFGRGLRVCDAASQDGKVDLPRVELQENVLEFHLDVDHLDIVRGNWLRCSSKGAGYACLHSLARNLVHVQRAHNWKFTLAQKTVGGASPTTASSLLAAGKLRDSLLTKLIDDYILVVHHLQALTRPHEIGAIDGLRQEVAAMADPLAREASHVSKLADSFTGFAIKKNFHPESGRFFFLRRIGLSFREGKCTLPEAEVLPARYLGMVLKVGAKMQQVFACAHPGPTALDTHFNEWYDLLKTATGLTGPSAVDLLWTCGITDGGLHNMFLGEDGLWFFDLGSPAAMPLPAFLTKFLFSFFHTLGMEETREGGWVTRFEVEEDGERLRLTPDTAEKLAGAYAAFEATQTRLLAEVFGGEEQVRELLKRYVVLQLLSDCAFCLQRWATKGGGTERDRPAPLDKWLWRALWDLFVATDVACKAA